MASPKRVLVTGGAGFLGSHLSERLLDDGHEVLCADNYFTGSKENVGHLVDHQRFEILRHDITFPSTWRSTKSITWRARRPPCITSSTRCRRPRPAFTAPSMLGLAKRTGAKILQASTSEVYGDPEVHPQPEDYRGRVNPIGPRACYDEGKRCAETLFFDYHRQNQVNIRVARIFNTYGPRMLPDDGRVVSNFIVQALKGEAITLYGDGSQTRAFCYVDDLIDGLVRLMDAGDEMTGPVNLGNPVEFTIAELAERVMALTGSKAKIENHPLPADDPTQRCPDIALARAKLGWEPAVALDDGLKKTIAYFEGVV